jgi:hypothetical protein
MLQALMSQSGAHCTALLDLHSSHCDGGGGGGGGDGGTLESQSAAHAVLVMAVQSEEHCALQASVHGVPVAGCPRDDKASTARQATTRQAVGIDIVQGESYVENLAREEEEDIGMIR